MIKSLPEIQLRNDECNFAEKKYLIVQSVFALFLKHWSESETHRYNLILLLQKLIRPRESTILCNYILSKFINIC